MASINRLKAVAYIRTSLSVRQETAREEAAASAELQARACSEFAATNDLQIVRNFVDDHPGSRQKDRPQLQALLDYCKQHKGHIDTVIVWRIDRFPRLLKEFVKVSEALKELGVRVSSVEHWGPSFEDSAALFRAVFGQ